MTYYANNRTAVVDGKAERKSIPDRTGKRGPDQARKAARKAKYAAQGRKGA